MPGLSPFGTKPGRFIFRAAFLLLFLVTSCVPELGFPAADIIQPPAVAPTQALPQAEVTFEVEIPPQTPAGQIISIDILDEVTGLALNPLRYPMEKIDDHHFIAHVPVEVGSVIKYRYLREGSPPAIEYTGQGKQVRYRLFHIAGPAEIRDVVTAWSDLAFRGENGRIQGQAIDGITGAPLPNILVAAGGVQTLSAADGSFLIEGLPIGTHNLVAYSLDGSYQPFQQGAVVASGSTTPTPLRMIPARQVNITFLVSVPPQSSKGLPIRIVGNIFQLGNTFADLNGGLSTVASRAPLLSLQADGKYSITLSLPAGLDLRYKYSLGDGFWNAEHTAQGKFHLRRLIVPEVDTTIQDVIETWSSPDSAPITFTVKVPDNTPPSDAISIQFNPYGWTEPLPMWPLGNNQWFYILYSPLQLFGNIGYRYCRNEQCGVADDIATQGNSAHGFPFSTSLLNQSFQDTVQKWAWWESGGSPSTLVATEVKPRGASFFAGVELFPAYHPSWQPYYGWAFLNLQELGAKWIVFTPTWSYTRLNPPVLEQVPGVDAFWFDLTQSMSWAGQRNLELAIFPISYDPITADEWWAKAARDAGWWQSWFDRYRTFILHHAVLAAQTNAKALILGEPGITPALPGGKLADGAPSGVPGDAEERWRGLIADVRTIYHGSLLWAVEYDEGLKNPPKFLSDVDQIYVLWSAGLAQNNAPPSDELVNEFGRLLDEQLQPFYNSVQKPVVLAISYPSVDGAAKGCIDANGQCLPFDVLDLSSSDTASVAVDLQEQMEIYNSALIAINQRDWIGGVVSRGYYPAAALQDKSTSIRGKPAADVLWYWFPRLLGQ